MPFPDLTTAGFTDREDSKKFDSTPIDPSIQFQTEGGVSISRRRFTRDPGYTFTTGFTNITDSDMQLLNSYYKGMGGGAVSFPYVHPTTGVTYQVRFQKPFKAKYTGVGLTMRWDVDELLLQSV